MELFLRAASLAAAPTTSILRPVVLPPIPAMHQEMLIECDEISVDKNSRTSSASDGSVYEGKDYMEFSTIEKSPSPMEEQHSPGGNYRAELKRPDLKGQFRCTICNKVFCHSSSLSRHRMQAHFKSYKCTLCRKDITSNENLRAHMYKQHQISRMFMCRCCNWAFPDKTSLHIHVQQREEGKSMSSSTSLTSAVPTFEQRESAPSAFAPLSAKTIPTSLSQLQTTNVFPLPLFPSAPTSLVPSAEDLARLRERLMLNTLVNQQNFGLAAAWLNQLPKPIPTTHLPMPEVQKVDEDDIDVDKCDVVKVEEDSENKANISLAAELSASKLTNIILSVKRSDSPTENASSSSTSGSSPAHTSSAHSPTNLLKKEAHTPSAFHHLNVDSRGFFETVSPLNVSPAETHSSVSPADGCYECSLYKSKLNAAESKCRYLDTRATNLQSETARTQSQLNNFESTLRQSETEAKILRESNELLQRRLKECQEQAIRFLQSDRMANPQAISLFMNQLIQTTLLR